MGCINSKVRNVEDAGPKVDSDLGSQSVKGSEFPQTHRTPPPAPKSSNRVAPETSRENKARQKTEAATPPGYAPGKNDSAATRGTVGTHAQDHGRAAGDGPTDAPGANGAAAKPPSGGTASALKKLSQREASSNMGETPLGQGASKGGTGGRIRFSDTGEDAASRHPADENDGNLAASSRRLRFGESGEDRESKGGLKKSRSGVSNGSESGKRKGVRMQVGFGSAEEDDGGGNRRKKGVRMQVGFGGGDDGDDDSTTSGRKKGGRVGFGGGNAAGDGAARKKGVRLFGAGSESDSDADHSVRASGKSATSGKSDPKSPEEAIRRKIAGLTPAQRRDFTSLSKALKKPDEKMSTLQTQKSTGAFMFQSMKRVRLLSGGMTDDEDEDDDDDEDGSIAESGSGDRVGGGSRDKRAGLLAGTRSRRISYAETSDSESAEGKSVQEVTKLRTGKVGEGDDMKCFFNHYASECSSALGAPRSCNAAPILLRSPRRSPSRLPSPCCPPSSLHPVALPRLFACRHPAALPGQSRYAARPSWGTSGRAQSARRSCSHETPGVWRKRAGQPVLGSPAGAPGRDQARVPAEEAADVLTRDGRRGEPGGGD